MTEPAVAATEEPDSDTRIRHRPAPTGRIASRQRTASRRTIGLSCPCRTSGHGLDGVWPCWASLAGACRSSELVGASPAGVPAWVGHGLRAGSRRGRWLLHLPAGASPRLSQACPRRAILRRTSSRSARAFGPHLVDRRPRDSLCSSGSPSAWTTSRGRRARVRFRALDRARAMAEIVAGHQGGRLGPGRDTTE